MSELHRALQEEHNLPIQKMGDIESYLKQKFDLETESQVPDRTSNSITPPTYYLRDPILSDE